MKKYFVSVVLLSFLFCSFSQSDTIKVDKRKTNRYGAWLIPSAALNIYGIAVGLVGSEAICQRPYTKFSHGLNIQIIGQGFFQTFYIKKLNFNTLSSKDTIKTGVFNESAPYRAIHNGLIVSPLGTFTDQVNGISLSLWMSMGAKINGLTANLLWNRYEQINGISLGLVNHSYSTNGLQIGLVNKTKKLHGFQIGLWNKNEKRTFPLINWNFRK